MGLPFKPGDWVADANVNVARVKDVYNLNGEALLDLVMFSRDGERLGRVSPAMGGPRGFEPAMNGDDWKRINKPIFPIQIKWVPSDTPGRVVARYFAGDRLPPLDWTPKPRRATFRMLRDDRLRKALQEIADGHNDARQVAKDTLAGRR